jgi:predicted secreted protein
MSNETKQTAVEWLINEIKFARNLCDDPSAEMDIWHTLDVLIAKGEQAKEMEKGQIKDAFVNGFCNAHDTEDKSLNADTIFYRTRYGGNK